jgi:hypothetical protein
MEKIKNTSMETSSNVSSMIPKRFKIYFIYVSSPNWYASQKLHRLI